MWGSFKKRNKETKGTLGGWGGVLCLHGGGQEFLFFAQKSKVPFFSALVTAWGLGQ